MKYFITGATGFVGGVLARKLHEQGHAVHASVRNPDQAQDLQDIGVKLFQGDVTDKDSMRAAMAGTEGVFQVAGWYKIGAHDKSPGERVNIQGTRHVLELMQELKIPKGVYTSTLAVNSDTHGQLVDENYRFHGRSLSEYDRTKAVAQALVREFMFKVLSVLAAPFDAVLPESYTLEGLRVVSGTTYIGDKSKAKRELGYTPRPFREGWTETVRHEMALLEGPQQ